MTAALAVDLLVLLTVALAAVHGLRSGAGVTVLGLLGGIAGLVVGRRLAGEVGALLGPGPHPFAAVVCVLLAIGLGWALGAAAGSVVAGGLRGIGLGWLDRIAGAVVRAGLALVVCWLIALAAIAFGSPAVADAARGSVLVQTAGERLGP